LADVISEPGRLDTADLPDSGVVHQDVDPSEPAHRGFCQCRYAIPRSHVGRHRQRLGAQSADLVLHSPESFERACGENEVRALLSERERNGPANSA
jgi:hypothetical protein